MNSFIQTSRPHRTLGSVLRGAVMALALGASMGATKVGAQAVSGNISPQAIEIDANANLYPSSSSVADWVKDNAANTDAKTLVNSIATGINPGITGASGGVGHWNGVRIVDGFAGNDKDIFLQGGKENDTSTWNIGPGTVGSSKYDITQAYLANNQQSLFFGMERRGNNGTTAFDFEFNQKAPGAATPLVPTRTIGDVLFTFEMSGSGSSGSAVPHYYVWTGTQYAERTIRGMVSSINQSPVPAAPWGYVDSQGKWTLGSLPNFSFAEAAVNIAEAFPNFNPCNTSAFVQVRTRSSSTPTSDLKDTTKVFEFKFAGPTAVSSFDPNCFQQFIYSSAGSKDTSGGTALSYVWDFLPPAGVTLSGSGLSGPDSGGYYHSTTAGGLVTVNLPAGVGSADVKVRLNVFQGSGCSTSTALQSVIVLRQLSAAITSKVANGSNMSVALTGSAPGATGVAWQKLDRSGNWVDISGATATTYAYASFESDSDPVVKSMVIDGITYQGKQWSVQIRLRAQRNAGGDICEAVSAPITLKKVLAVDP